MNDQTIAAKFQDALDKIKLKGYYVYAVPNRIVLYRRSNYGSKGVQVGMRKNESGMIALINRILKTDEK